MQFIYALLTIICVPYTLACLVAWILARWR